jgi:hypothetical protein
MARSVSVKPVSQADIFKAMNQAIDGMSTDQIKAAAHDRGSRLYTVMRLHKRYENAYTASAKYGYIGVGCITFAANRVGRFCQRTGIRVNEGEAP